MQLDRTIDDVTDNTDSSWNAICDSAGRIGDSGYTVEMRIPLSQLRFEDTEGEQTWGGVFLGYSDANAQNDGFHEPQAADRRWFLKVGYAWAMWLDEAGKTPGFTDLWKKW